MRITLFFLAITLFSCDINELEVQTMKGLWAWESSCGGIAGCFEANTAFEIVLGFTASEMKVTENGVLKYNQGYRINASARRGGKIQHEVEFDDGMMWTVTVSPNKLETDNGIMISKYRRIY